MNANNREAIRDYVGAFVGRVLEELSSAVIRVHYGEYRDQIMIKVDDRVNGKPHQAGLTMSLWRLKHSGSSPAFVGDWEASRLCAEFHAKKAETEPTRRTIKCALLPGCDSIRTPPSHAAACPCASIQRVVSHDYCQCVGSARTNGRCEKCSKVVLP